VKIRLLFAAVCIFILPFVFSPSAADKLAGTAPFASVAFAGHTIAGYWCECGTPGCICDPGELPVGNRAASVTDNKSSDQGPSPVRANPRSGPDLGTGALILALALVLWARLRA
jgi:hypothetical protein